MNWILYFVFCAASSAAVPLIRDKFLLFPHSLSPKGTQIDISEVPWHVSLEYFGAHICGGSIIAARWVVTAAHCTDGSTADTIRIRAGTSISGSGGQIVNVTRINQNPSYDAATVDWDISVLELSSDLEFSSNVAAVNLPQSGEDWAEGTDVLATGWGSVSGVPNNLIGEALQVVSRATCNDDYGDGIITERMLCAGANGADVSLCQGNSGSPLIAGNKLVGLTSWGIGCGRPEFPGVYSHMGTLRDYVTDVSGI